MEAFDAAYDPLAEYGRTKTRAGAATALTLVLAHGVEADFEKVTTTFPTGPSGEAVGLKPYSKRAKEYASKLAEMLEKRAAAREASRREAAAKGAEASESAA